jgi:glycosyltransferase involved in cell wall biosynthesis
MTRVLIVSYHFPPVGGGGVQRVSMLARYLPEFGIEPVVLTGPDEFAGHWTPEDPTLLEEVRDVAVVRVPGPVPPASEGLRATLQGVLGQHGPFSEWWARSIVTNGVEQVGSVDAIIGELIPYPTAFGVERLSRQVGVPWIADLQDPWALDEMWLYQTAIHRLTDRARMRSTLRSASAVVMNTPEAAKRMRAAFPEFRTSSVVSITNGFDAHDFEGPPPRRNDGIFRIVHSGYLHTNLGLRHRRTRRARRLLGGMAYPSVDFLTRSHVYLLRAVGLLLRDDPSLTGTIEVHLVGSATDDDRAAAAPYPFVRFHGYMAHLDAIAMIRTADLLFLPMQDLRPGTRAGLVPGKTYEYMASGVPILAAVPDGDARDMLTAIGTASVCRPADVECLARSLRARIDAWRNGVPLADPDRTVLRRFERQSLTSEMAALIESTLSADKGRSSSSSSSSLGRSGMKRDHRHSDSPEDTV